MFVGHGLLAFALAAFAAERRSWPPRRALTLGVVAGAFATLPDVDVAYALIAIDGGGSVRPDVLRDAANSVHRSVIHSLIVAAIAGPALGAWSSRRERRARRLALGALVAVVAVAVAVSGARGGIVMGAAAGGLATASACRRWTDLPPGPVGVAATVGFASHPYGDLLTGQPPRLFYPFDTSVSSARLVLHPDLTLHLLGAFALELATIWLAVLAVVVVTDRSWRVFSGSSALPGVAAPPRFRYYPRRCRLRFTPCPRPSGSASSVPGWRGIAPARHPRQRRPTRAPTGRGSTPSRPA